MSSSIWKKIEYILVIFCYCFIAFIFGLLISQSDDFRKFLWRVSQIHLNQNDRFVEDIVVFDDVPEKSHNGLLLLNYRYQENPAIVLVDKKGKIQHQWNLPLTELFGNLKHQQYLDFLQRKRTKLFRHDDSHLYQNGDLLTIVAEETEESDTAQVYDFAYLLKMDKDSNIIWQINDFVHHEFEINDAGKIFVIASKIIDDYPIVNQTNKTKPQFVDFVIKEIDSETGQILRVISVTDAIKNSKYQPFLATSRFQGFELPDSSKVFDILHVNDLIYVEKNMANLVPFLEEGDLIVSVKGLDAIAVLRPKINSIVWMTKGPWIHQHHIELTDVGKLRIFNNVNHYVMDDKKEQFARHQERSSIIDYDLMTHETKIIYNDVAKRSLQSWSQSLHQEIDDGFIFTFTDKGRIINTDFEGNILWELSAIKDRLDDKQVLHTKEIVSSRHYKKSYAKFLNE